jgi:hypothetical protein
MRAEAPATAPPADARLLDLWERGRDASPGERALLLLGLAEPGTAPEELGARTVGRRDAALLELRARTFGERLACLATCAGCGEQLEMDFSVTDILLSTPPLAPPELTLVSGAERVTFRLPTAADVAALGRSGNGLPPERALLRRCVIAAYRGEEPISADELSDALVAAVGERMLAADPQAEVHLDLTCPACGARWRALFDIVGFFWREIEAWAVRTLREVHALATAYGWSEREILALSPWRRRFYLELVGA